MQLSAWERETFFARQDVIILGSGLVGLWSALELKAKNPALKVTILERGIIPAGASTRNAGFACMGSPSELLADAAANGEDRMWQLVEMRYKGIEKIIRSFSDSMIEFSRCGGYEVYDDNTNLEQFDEKVAGLNKGIKRITGAESCFRWSNEKLPAFGLSGFKGMIETSLEGHLHSGRLVQELIRRVQSLGVQLFTHTKVDSWEQSGNAITVHAGELEWTTSQLLVCTNAFTPELLPDTCIVPARGQVLLTRPVKDLKLRGSFHFQEGFYYFRDLGNRLLLGGARNSDIDNERNTSLVVTDTIQQELEGFIRRHLLRGQAFEIEQRWSGIMGFTEDKQPIVRRVNERVMVAVACNGMGVALSPVIAEKVCEMMS